MGHDATITITVIEPDIDTDLIESFAGEPDGEAQIIKAHIGIYDSENNFSEEATKKALKEREAILSITSSHLRRAYEKLANQYPFRFVRTGEGHEAQGEKVAPSWWLLFEILIPAVLGFFVIATTMVSVIAKGEKFEFLLDYPILGIMFTFLPVAAMVIIGHAYGCLSSEGQQKAFRHRLWLLCGLSFLPWVATFMPAYAPPSNLEENDLLAVVSGNELVFEFHIAVQIVLEVLTGGALKAAIFDISRDNMAHISVPHEVYTADQDHVDLSHKNSKEPEHRVDFLSSYLATHLGARDAFVGKALACFRKAKSNFDNLEKMIKAKSALVEAKIRAELSAQENHNEVEN